MYHGVIAGAATIVQARESGATLYDLAVEKFKAQMEYLKNNSYRVCKIDDLNNGKTKKDVVLTFDDGELSNSQVALPILVQNNFPAYFFITTRRIGQQGYMGWKELMYLRDAGMVVGSHGLTHEILTTLNMQQLKEELSDSKKILEKELKIKVEYFSVPRGFYNEKIIQLAKEAGYKKIFVSDLNNDHEDYCIGRVAVKNFWSMSRFKVALDGEIPILELFFNFLKNPIKKFLGGKSYDRFRRILLKEHRDF